MVRGDVDSTMLTPSAFEHERRMDVDALPDAAESAISASELPPENGLSVTFEVVVLAETSQLADAQNEIEQTLPSLAHPVDGAGQAALSLTAQTPEIASMSASDVHRAPIPEATSELTPEGTAGDIVYCDEAATALSVGESGGSFELMSTIRDQPLLYASDEPNRHVPRLGFAELGEPREPGEYRSRFGLVEVTREDLAVWKVYPKARFTVLQPSPYSDALVSRLGTFDV